MIPLSTPNICGNSWKYVKECLDAGEWVSTAGSYVNKFEDKIADYKKQNMLSHVSMEHLLFKLALG